MAETYPIKRVVEASKGWYDSSSVLIDVRDIVSKTDYAGRRKGD